VALEETWEKWADRSCDRLRDKEAATAKSLTRRVWWVFSWGAAKWHCVGLEKVERVGRSRWEGPEPDSLEHYRPCKDSRFVDLLLGKDSLPNTLGRCWHSRSSQGRKYQCEVGKNMMSPHLSQPVLWTNGPFLPCLYGN
jgi:hypothetical protein